MYALPVHITDMGGRKFQLGMHWQERREETWSTKHNLTPYLQGTASHDYHSQYQFHESKLISSHQFWCKLIATLPAFQAHVMFSLTLNDWSSGLCFSDPILWFSVPKRLCTWQLNIQEFVSSFFVQLYSVLVCVFISALPLLCALATSVYMHEEPL